MLLNRRRIAAALLLLGGVVRCRGTNVAAF